jgi:tetratricopeptide (TPR) repeat protein
MCAADTGARQQLAQLQTQQSGSQSDVAATDASQASAAFATALKLLRDSKYDEAVKQYMKLTAGQINPGLAYAGLARSYLKLENVDEASAAAAKAIEVAPTLDDAHVAMGEVYFRQGKIVEAEREFIALIKANTSNPRSYLGEARISTVSSFHKQAQLMLDRARILDPGDPDIRNTQVGVRNFQQEMNAVQKVLTKSEGTGGDPSKSTAPSNPCHLVSGKSSMQMNLEPILDGPRDIRAYGLMVKVNGVSSKLELDTGASGILVDRKIAEKAKITRLLELGVGGIGDKGEAGGYVGLAESIHIGDLEFQNCYVRVIDKNSVLDHDGLIGSDMFSAFLVDIDFPKEKFRLNELPRLPEGMDPELHDRYVAPEMKAFSPVYLFGRDLLIRTRINDSAPKLFLLDTGGGLDSISPDAAREFTGVSSDSTVIVKGLNGSVEKLFSGDRVTLQFGNLRQEVRDIVAFDTSPLSRSEETEISGIIGFPTLRLIQMKIDYRDGLVLFNYDSNRVH